jgi:hypothetical protein
LQRFMRFPWSWSFVESGKRKGRATPRGSTM